MVGERTLRFAVSLMEKMREENCSWLGGLVVVFVAVVADDDFDQCHCN